MKFFIYCQISPDYKYSRIFDGLDVECKVVTAIQFLRLVFGRKETNTKYIYHIRYLLWRGFLLTLPMYCLIILACKLRKIPILFTCHNLVEHRYPSKFYNLCVRTLVCLASKHIIVLHEDIKNRLARFGHKTQVACFGDFRGFFEDKHQPNDVFNRGYQDWLKRRGIAAPDIMFVGRYTPYNDVGLLVRFLEGHSQINGLIVSDGCPIESSAENIFIFNRKVFAELEPILRSTGVVGCILICNLSISTSAYVYAGYKIPVMVRNKGPVASLIKKYKTGEVFDSQDDMHSALMQIKNNYQSYHSGMELFNHENNWQHSRKVHQAVLDQL